MNPRIIDKTTIIKDSLSIQQTAKPFIVRIPHIQTKAPFNSESGKVVIVKSNPSATNSSTASPVAAPSQSGTRSFSVVKLADGQIVLVPANIQPQQPMILNENGISRIIKAPSTSPPNPTGVISTIKRVTKEQSSPRVSTIQITNLSSSPGNFKSSPQSTPSTSPQERRLRAIAPAPSALPPSTTDLLNSLLVQQQQMNAASAETLLRFDPTVSVLLGEEDPLPIISETVTLDSNGSSLRNNNKRRLDSLPIEQKTSLPVVSSTSIEQKPKTIRKTTTTTTASSNEKSNPKARLENKATSIIKDARKKMTPRQVSVPAAAATTTTLPVKPVPETKIQKTPLKKPVASALPPKIDPEQGIRYDETRKERFLLKFRVFFLKNENLRNDSSFSDWTNRT